ncbi:MAG TPA: GAF and ANTAR domain-containing protein [Sporichthyaceae bacterium]|jgi:transcriptional regulator with GAF, ATPase, and Fis domain|nr:GAF and ANTAR domain-containing protein [Sporichthyaceae bacterium]
MKGDREGAVIAAFVSIAEALAEDYDIVDLYTGLTATCVQLLDVDWAGLLLVDSTGVLRVAATSSEHARNLELVQLQCEQGPCVDCFEKGEVVSVPDLGPESGRWPRFAPAAVAAGFASVHAVPMKLHSTVLGALGMFRARTGELAAGDLLLARSLANVACVALVAARAAADGKALNAQLQHALDSRIIVEQAKGFLAQYGGLDVDQSFALLRKYSRDRNLRLTDVALHLLDRQLLADVVLSYVPEKGLGRRSARTQ